MMVRDSFIESKRPLKKSFTFWPPPLINEVFPPYRLDPQIRLSMNDSGFVSHSLQPGDSLEREITPSPRIVVSCEKLHRLRSQCATA